MQDFYVEKRTENGIEDGYVAVSVSQINLLAQLAIRENVKADDIITGKVDLSEFNSLSFSFISLSIVGHIVIVTLTYLFLYIY